MDEDPRVAEQLSTALGDATCRLRRAGTLAEARRAVDAGRVDLMLMAAHLPDGSALPWAEQLRRRQPGLRAILLTDQPSVDQAVAAMRAGAADMLIKPLDLALANQRVQQVLAEGQNDRRMYRRVHRLRRICRRLNAARIEISRQVDVLCSDLIGAYRELAEQVQHVVKGGEFAQVAAGELDLEKLLRKTLEYLLEQAGPTNAAVFLPATMDEYSLGGYINYDWSAASPEVLLAQLADVVAPKVAERPGVTHITDDRTLRGWAGGEADCLAGCHLAAACCRDGQEPLAVIVLFRKADDPFQPKLLDTLESISTMLGEYLGRIIRIHHRHKPGPEYGSAA